MTQGTDRGGAPAETVADVGTSGDGSGVDEGPVLSIEETSQELIATDVMHGVVEVREAWMNAKRSFYELGEVFAKQEKTSKGLKGVIDEYNRQYPCDQIDYGSAKNYAQLYSMLHQIDARRLASVKESFSQSLLLEATREADQQEFEFRLLLAEENDWTVREMRKYRQAKKLQERISQLKMPKGQYEVIVVDPPWPHDGDYDPSAMREVPQYQMATLEAIEKMEIPAARNCVLWLWTINRLLHDALHIVEMWGFETKTVLTWAKNRFGTGRWLRGQTEHCILAVKGTPIWKLTNQSTLLEAPVREHSRKPDEFYELARSLCPDEYRRLDMFSREKREGWRQWGDECDKF